MKNLFSFVTLLLLSTGPLLSLATAAPLRIALNWKPEPEFGGFYAAEQQGYFKEEGLQVHMISGGSSQPVPQMVAAGKVEFGILTADEVLIARSKGADLVALFATFQTNPQAILVHEESGIDSFEKLFNSKTTLSLVRGLPYTTFLEKKYGFSNVKIVPYNGGIGPFLANKNFAQQCYLFSEPLAARRAKAKSRSLVIADAGFNPYATMIVARGDFVAKNKAEIEKLVRAVRKGWLHYMKSPQPTNAHMHTLNSSLDLETYDEGAKVLIPLIQTKEVRGEKVGTMTLQRWKDLHDILLNLKLLSKPVDVTQAFANF